MTGRSGGPPGKMGRESRMSGPARDQRTMDELVRALGMGSWVVDIGAGPGSFDYASTRARVVSVDLAFPKQRHVRALGVTAPAERLPIRTAIADVVVCNHSLEHFPDPKSALGEVDRVLKPGGFCWIAVPDGYSLDDRLYRFLFAGGGHLSRFSVESFLRAVQEATELNLVSFKDLFSGFVYLAPPNPERLKYFPQPARTMFSLAPARGLLFLARWLAHLTRSADRLFGSHMSRYGWGFVLQKGPVSGELRHLPNYVNVCVGCGAGHPAAALVTERERLGWAPSYRCPLCGVRNIYFEAPTRATVSEGE